MKRVTEVEFETICKNHKTAINRFFTRYPKLGYWKEQFEYMEENNQDFCCDNLMANGERNNDWCYALHFDRTEDHYYLCIIERA